MRSPAPEERFLMYSVRSGDTVQKIADRFSINSKILINENNLSNPNKLEVGQQLLIPMNPEAYASKQKTLLGWLAGSSKHTVKLGNAKRLLGTLKWPIESTQVSSNFGTRYFSFHEGLDIRAPEGTPIRAAHSGEVLYAGRGLSGYGNMIVLRSQGILTVYAHNQRNDVRTGDTVDQGDYIGAVGMTGKASGPHLHFEVRLETENRTYRAVNPIRFLRVPGTVADDLHVEPMVSADSRY